MTEKRVVSNFEVGPSALPGASSLTQPIDTSDIPDSKPGTRFGSLQDAINRSRARQAAAKHQTPERKSGM